MRIDELNAYSQLIVKTRELTMNTIEKGNKLEDWLYDYLLDQRDRGEPVFDVYSPDLCKLYKKKKYYCKVRDRDVGRLSP